MEEGCGGKRGEKSIRSTTNHRTNRLVQSESRSDTGSFDSLRSLRISAAGSDARKTPQDAGNVRLSIGVDSSPSSFRWRVYVYR